MPSFSEKVFSPFQRPVKRLDARTASPEEWALRHDGRCPVLLEHALETAAPWHAADWESLLLERHHDREVQYFVRKNQDAPPHYGFEPHVGKLGHVWHEAMAASDHAAPVHFIDEVLLQGELAEAIRGRLPAFMQQNHFTEEAFVRTADMDVSSMAVIRGGRGTRSEFHVDHLDWVGWNVLLRGEKMWKWWKRTPENARLLGQEWVPKFRRRHRLGLAAGCLSATDAFADPVPGCPGTFIPRLSPHGIGGALPPPDFETVQRAGEMVVFPGGWWHQVYHVTDTVAIASQYCNDRTLPGVLAHVLRWCGLPPAGAGALLRRLEGRGAGERVAEALSVALILRSFSSDLQRREGRLQQIEERLGMPRGALSDTSLGPPLEQQEDIHHASGQVQPRRAAALARAAAPAVSTLRCGRQLWPRRRRRRH